MYLPLPQVPERGERGGGGREMAERERERRGLGGRDIGRQTDKKTERKTFLE